MIDISQKKTVERSATATGKIFLQKDTIQRIKEHNVKKGDVLTIAKVAGINAVKKVPDLIPFCHPIPITKVSLEFTIQEVESSIQAICTVKTIAKTGVEMEALTGVSVALLNIWDVVKMYEKDNRGQYPSSIIKHIRVEEKIKKK
ncbi:MAG: putative cyclic pyranopterin monophosphate synthase [Promethearchaeota archaeon]|nr:MAG: putative cyclic pyranopterin monophosphate synthase [Candidatus Lokiarchaeota archaeon]